MRKSKTAATAAPPQRRHIIVIGGAVVLAGLIAWLASSKQARVSPTAPTASSGVSSASATAAPTDPSAPKRPTAYKQKPPPEGKAFIAAEQVRAALAHYLEYSVYPPWSRPADDSQKHLWEWNKYAPHGQAFARDKDNNPLSAQLHLDRMFAGAGEAITATVTVWRGSYEAEKKDPVDATVTGSIEVWRDAQPQSNTPSGWFPVTAASFASLEGGPGRRYVAKFIPSTMPALQKESEARFVATVHAGNHKMPFTENFRCAATTPLVVLSNHTDRLANGSLEVTLAVDVKQLGAVMVQATLFDGTGEKPIAIYDDFYRPAQLGPQEMKIVFFGKAIRELGIDGPYLIKALHGFVKVADMEPPEVYWSHETPIRTGAYAASAFSDEEWDAPEKQDKINHYKTMITQLEGAKP